VNSTPDIETRAETQDSQQRSYLAPVLSPRQKLKYLSAILIWVGFAGFFWAWWLQPSNVIGIGRFVLMTLAIFWVFFLQSYFLYFFFNARRSQCDAARIIGTPRNPQEKAPRPVGIPFAACVALAVISRSQQSCTAGVGTFSEWLAPQVAPASLGLSLSRSR